MYKSPALLFKLLITDTCHLLKTTFKYHGPPTEPVTTLPTPLRHQDGSHLCESQTPGKGFKTLACHSSVTNLAMIFKLEAQQGIYTVHSEEEAEIILPSESGTVLVEDFSKTYVVNGEPVVSVIPPQSPSTSLGIPISYQQPRSKTNPPPANGRCKRPTFKVV